MVERMSDFSPAAVCRHGHAWDVRLSDYRQRLRYFSIAISESRVLRSGFVLVIKQL